jgi:hypothetical protein
MPVYRVPVTITAPFAGGSCNNTWHVRTGAVPGDEHASFDAAVAAIRTFYSTLKDFYPATTTITCDAGIEVDEKYDYPVTWATLTSGTTPAGTAPPHLAICINWLTTSRTRRGRGRTFFGPLAPSHMQTDGTPVDGSLTQFRTAATALCTASLVDNGWAVAIYGLQSPAPKPPPADLNTLPHVARDIVSAKINDKFAVMRSRRP